MTTNYEGLLGVHVYPYLALARGYVCVGGGGGYFHDKAKNIRDKMSNLGNSMMISELFFNNNYN